MVTNVKKGQGTNQTWDGLRRNLIVTFYQNFLQGVFPFMLKFYRKISIPFYYKYQTLSLHLFKTKRNKSLVQTHLCEFTFYLIIARFTLICLKSSFSDISWSRIKIAILFTVLSFPFARRNGTDWFAGWSTWIYAVTFSAFLKWSFFL